MLSIITPVYNGEEFIQKNIESIQKLTIPFEHIIIDGNSQDGTLDITSKYPHLKVHQQDGRAGMYQAIHQGFEKAKGDYITWVNCDDTIVLEGFEKMYSAIKSKDLDLIYSDSVLFHIHDNIKQKVKGIPFGKYFMSKGFLPFVQPSSIYKKSLYEKAGGLDYKNYRIIGDRDLFTRMALVDGSKIDYLKTTSTIFLKHGNSLGDNNQELYLKESRKNNRTPGLFTKIFYRFLQLTNKIG